MWYQPDHMRVAGIITGGATDHFEVDLASYHGYRTHNVMLMCGTAALFDGHKIGNLRNAIHSQKARDQDVGIGQVELFVSHARRLLWGNAKEAALISIKQRS